MLEVSKSASEKHLGEQSNEGWFKIRQFQKPHALVGIAKGDSWFDYAPAWVSDVTLGDLINQLNQRETVNILRNAKAGDTLENMTFGSEPDGQFNCKSPQFDRTLELIREYQPDFLLFSGGGNDISGGNGLKFEPFLNHAKSKLGVLRERYLDYVIHAVFSEIFEYLIQEVIQVKPDIQIFLHGYGYPIPNGRGVMGVMGFEFMGPWLEPALTRKGLSEEQGKVVIDQIMDALNEMMIGLVRKYPANVTHIDLRTLIEPLDWENELHLTALGYQKVADQFESEIQRVFLKKMTPPPLLSRMSV